MMGRALKEALKVETRGTNLKGNEEPVPTELKVEGKMSSCNCKHLTFRKTQTRKSTSACLKPGFPPLVN